MLANDKYRRSPFRQSKLASTIAHLIFILFVTNNGGFSQNIDSLERVYLDAHNALSKIEVALDISKNTVYTDRALATLYVNRADSLLHFVDTSTRYGMNLQARVYGNMGLVELDNGNAKTAYDLLENAIAIGEEQVTPDPADEFYEVLIVSLINFGRGKHIEGKLHEALKKYLEAMEYCRVVGDVLRESILLYNISLCYQNIGVEDKSLTALKDLRKLPSVESARIVRTAAARAIAQIQYSKDSLKMARVWFSKAMEEAQTYHYERVLQETMLGMGLVCEREGKLDSAELYFAKVESLLVTSYLPENDFELRLNWSRLAAKRGEVQLARMNLEKAEELVGNLQNPFFEASLLTFKSVLESEKSFDERFDYLQDARRLKDSLYSAQNKSLFFEIEEKYRIAEKEKLILEQELQLQSNAKQKGLLVFGIGALVVLLIWVYIAFSQRSKKRKYLLELQHSRIRDLESRNKILGLSSLIQGQENERVRIAKDLHDGLGGLLATVKAHYESLVNSEDPSQHNLAHHKAQTMMDDAVEEVRRISHNMMPPLLRTNGLGAAVRSYVENVALSHGLSLMLDLRNVDEPLDENKSLFIYRIIQELTSNVLKHSAATEVQLQMIRLPDEIQVIFEDNGVGFSYDSTQDTGVGLRSIRSRVDFLDGELDFTSLPGFGTQAEITIPI